MKRINRTTHLRKVALTTLCLGALCATPRALAFSGPIRDDAPAECIVDGVDDKEPKYTFQGEGTVVWRGGVAREGYVGIQVDCPSDKSNQWRLCLKLTN